ncbi:hypothetical protein C8J56DRAFT_1067270 [Mycena floridula]|nr:hypothetical protein C8J56DRAFT_1067270 [Mycena floridula]
MVLAGENDQSGHPYWYACVIAIFHAHVQYRGGQAKQTDFLFVCWYVLDTTFNAGFKAKRLFRVGFGKSTDLETFGFINPADMLRAVHLIPVFSLGRTKQLFSKSVARRDDEQDEYYRRYSVNIFVDRDMLMRFTGQGVGHRETRTLTRSFRDDLGAAFAAQPLEPTDGAGDSDLDDADQDQNPGDSDLDSDESEREIDEEEDDDFLGEEQDLGFDAL